MMDPNTAVEFDHGNLHNQNYDPNMMNMNMGMNVNVNHMDLMDMNNGFTPDGNFLGL
jgi:hypothetical protein